jgi:hypothetical protein
MIVSQVFGENVCTVEVIMDRDGPTPGARARIGLDLAALTQQLAELGDRLVLVGAEV